MSGVLAKIFAAAPFKKTSAAGYSVLCVLVSAIISGIVLLIFFRNRGEKQKFSLSATIIGAANGITNRLANFLLLIALTHVDASVQYPLVTGGTMIFSTLVCFFGKNKPSRKEILSVLVVFVGMLALFVVLV